MLRLLVVTALLGTVLPVARALAVEADPDTEIAQRTFAEGVAAYSAHDYARALERFEAARRVKPLPAFDYNIARCHDRLDHPAEAIAAYQRYLALKPDAPDAAEVRARVAVLQSRVAAPPPASAPAPAPARDKLRYTAPIAVGVVGLVLVATGAGLAGSVGPDYDALDRRWAAEGPTPGVMSSADSLRAREIAGWTLLAAGGVAVIADVALWIVARRHKPTTATQAHARGAFTF